MSERLRDLEMSSEASLMELDHLAAALVGAGRVWEIQDRIARCMLMEALRQTAANYTRTALLLGVKRQAIQQMVVRFELEAWAGSLRAEKSEVPRAILDPLRRDLRQARPAPHAQVHGV